MTIEHGTYSGLVNHYRNGETPCDPCLKAGADYREEWLSNPERLEMERARQRAFSRARTRLAQKHREEYQGLYQDAVGVLVTEGMTLKQRNSARQKAQRQAKATIATRYPEQWDRQYEIEKSREKAL